MPEYVMSEGDLITVEQALRERIEDLEKFLGEAPYGIIGSLVASTLSRYKKTHKVIQNLINETMW